MQHLEDCRGMFVDNVIHFLGLFQANNDAPFSGWKGFCKTKRERAWVGHVDVEWICWIPMEVASQELDYVHVSSHIYYKYQFIPFTSILGHVWSYYPLTLFNVTFTPSWAYGISATTNLVAWYTIVHRGYSLYIYNWLKITPCEKEVLEKQYIYLWICDDVRVNVTRQFCLLNDTMLTFFFRTILLFE